MPKYAWPPHARRDRSNAGKTLAFPRVTPICCNSWRTIWCIRRSRFRSRERLAPDTANARRAPLQLETLFGSGPVGSPFVYALDAPNDDRRTKLRLGRMRWKDKERRDRLPVPRHRADPGRERHRDRPQHRRNARCADRGAGRRSPQRRSRHHVAADRAVRAAAQRPDRHRSPRRTQRPVRTPALAPPTSASCARATR